MRSELYTWTTELYIWSTELYTWSTELYVWSTELYTWSTELYSCLTLAVFLRSLTRDLGREKVLGSAGLMKKSL